eukprot:TCONS_00021377-protein
MKFVLLTCLFVVINCDLMNDETQVRDFSFNTANQQIRTIQEVVAKEGTPGASSPPWAATYTVDKAFNHPNYYRGFHSKDPYGNAPEMIWYHFRTGFKPAEVTFRVGETASVGPAKYQIVGTNDEHCNQYSIWDILCEDLSGEKFVTRYQIKRCVVSDFHTKSYNCIGIRVFENSSATRDYGIGNIRFWKKV